MSGARDLQGDFAAAARGSVSGSKKRAAKPTMDPIMELKVAEQAMTQNARALDKVARRLRDECEDRLGWIHKLKTILVEEERTLLHRRRSCDELSAFGARQMSAVEAMTAHHSRRHAMPSESLANRERMADERITAVQHRADEIAELFGTLDAKEDGAVQRGIALTRRDDELDRLHRDAQRIAKELKLREYSLEDRRRTAERRLDAVSLWESRLERREAELAKAERNLAMARRDATDSSATSNSRGAPPPPPGATQTAATMPQRPLPPPAAMEVEAIDIDGDDDTVDATDDDDDEF